VLKTIC